MTSWRGSKDLPEPANIMSDIPAPSVAAPVDSAAPPFRAPAFFAHKDRVARWSLTAVLVLGVSQGLTLVLVFYLATRPPWLAGAGRPTSLAEAKDVQVEQSLLATQALLQRSAADFDWPELLEAHFSRPALAQAAALKASEAQEFHDKGISQKAHVRQIEALDTRPDQVRVAITGRLERHCVLQQQPFTEQVPFTLRLNFRLNPDVLGARRHPLVVTDFELTYPNAN